MTATAIVLSSQPFQKKLDGWEVLNHLRTFSSLEELHANRLEALLKVTTPFCAYVDDDELPENTAQQISDIMGRMEREHSNLTYTDWLEKSIRGTVRRSPGVYNRAKHITSPVWMHQLVVMRTEAAQEIARSLPQGVYWTEFLLYAQLAKTSPIYYPEIGYIWNRNEAGMHRHKQIVAAQINSVRWYLQRGLR